MPIASYFKWQNHQSSLVCQQKKKKSQKDKKFIEKFKSWLWLSDITRYSDSREKTYRDLSILILGWHLDFGDIKFRSSRKILKVFTEYPANIYMFKVKNRNTGIRCEICSKLTIKTPE